MRNGVGALITERAAGAGGDVALAEGRTGRTLTWAGLAEVVDAWAARAACPAQAIILKAGRPLEFIGAYLGLLVAGAVVLPMDPDGGDGELSAAIAGFEVGAVASGEDLRPLRPGASALRWAEPGTVVLRTSGSTGAPKGVPLTEAQLLHAATLVAGHHGLSPADTVYSCLPLFHINAQVVGVLAALVSGARLVVDDRFHRRGFWEAVGRCGVTVLNAVPPILAILAEEPPPPSSVARGIRFARSASAPLPLATLRSFEARCGIEVLETYGMTEASGQICANPLDAAARRAGSVGQPVGVELRMVDDAGEPVAAQSPGLIEIRGPSVATHYVVPGVPPHRRPAGDASGWLRTGDVAYRDAGGNVVLMGRIDGVINRGGEKVYPREVEEVLRGHAGVADAAVVGEPDPVLGEQPVAFVVARGDANPAALQAGLLERCERELSRHKRPVRILLADNLPSTPTGKVRADELRAMAARETGAMADRETGAVPARETGAVPARETGDMAAP